MRSIQSQLGLIFRETQYMNIYQNSSIDFTAWKRLAKSKIQVSFFHHAEQIEKIGHIWHNGIVKASKTSLISFPLFKVNEL